MPGARLATAIGAEDVRLRVSYTPEEIADLQAEVDTAQRSLDAAIAAGMAPRIRDRRRTLLVAAQAALAAAEDYLETETYPALDLRPGQLARIGDSFVLVLKVNRTSIDVVRGYLGTDVAPHAAGAELVPVSPIGTAVIEVLIDGGGAPIQAGEKARVVVPWPAGRIERVQLVADQVGAAVLDILRSAFGEPPGTGASIVASAKPTLDAASTYDDAELEGWDLALGLDDVLQVVVESASSVERLTVVFTVGL